MAEDGGVEPHPISENLVFKASRRTIPAASSSINFGLGHRLRTCTFLAPNEVDFLLSQSELYLLAESVGIEPTGLLITTLHLSRVLHYRPAHSL